MQEQMQQASNMFGGFPFANTTATKDQKD